MAYRVFYFFERSGDSVSSTSPIEMSLKAVREQLLHRLRGEDDYLGIVDSSDNVLQILRDSVEDRYWVELPVNAARASYGRCVTRAELEDLILGLPHVFDRDRIPGMDYRPW
jgi:hypothetical protein